MPGDKDSPDVEAIKWAIALLEIHPGVKVNPNSQMWLRRLRVASGANEDEVMKADVDGFLGVYCDGVVTADGDKKLGGVGSGTVRPESGAPIGYAVRMADGPFVGIWQDRAVAERVCAKQPLGHGDKVVPVYAAPVSTRRPLSQDWKDIFEEYRSFGRSEAWLYQQIVAHAARTTEADETARSATQERKDG